MNTTPHLARRYRRTFASVMTLLAATGGFAQTTTTGYQNITRTEARGALLSHPMDTDNGSNVLGRTTNVNYLRGWLIVGPFANTNPGMLIYDISNPKSPARRLPDTHFGHSYTTWRGNTGWNAHGSAQTTDTFLLPSITVSSFGGAVSRGLADNKYPLAYNRSSMSGPWYASMQWYGSTAAQFEMRKFYWNPNLSGGGQYEDVLHGTIDHVAQYGGGDWHPIYFGDLLIYVRSDDNSSTVVGGRDGVVVYRIRYENFENATLSQRKMYADPVATLSTGFSAYWPNLYSDGTKLYVVGSSSSRVMAADITDAADPLVDGPVTPAANYSTSLNNATYPVYQDNFAFIHNKKFDMSLLLAGNANPISLELDEYNSKQAVGETTVHPDGVDTTQMSLPLGNLWLTGGYPHSGKSPGMGIWVQEIAPDTKKPVVAFHIPQKDRGNYPRFAPLSFLIHEVPRRGAVRPGIDFTVRPVNLSNNTLGTHVSGYGIHDMSGIYTYTPDTPLAANTTYQVDFLSSNNGTPTNLNDDVGFQDAAGNLMDAYNFRFSTGSLTPPTPPTLGTMTVGTYQPAAGASTNITVSATGTGLQYRFNVNGTWSAWGTSNTTSVSYLNPGRYRVSIQVKNSAGGIANTYVNFLVPAGGALANAPTHSNTMAVGEDTAGRRLWVVNPDSNTVSVLNADTGAKINEYPVGQNPRSIARDSNGRYWVTLHGEDKIVILNQSGSIYETIGGETTNPKIPYGAAPFAIAPNHNGTQMFVSYYGSGKLARFTVPTSGAVQAPTVNTDANNLSTARAIAVRYDGTNTRVFVTRFISEDHRAQVAEFNGGTLARTRTFDIAYVTEVDAGDNGAGVMNYLAGIAITPDGKYAVVTGKKDNIGRGRLYTDPAPAAGHPVGVGDLTPINTVRAMMAVLNLTTNAEITSARRDFDNSDSPTSVTFSSRGDTAFIALQGNDRVVGIDSIDLTTGAGSALESLSAGTGPAPQGVLYDANKKRLFVQNFMGRSVSVFNASDFHDKNLGTLPLHVTTDTVTTELLAPDVLEGKVIFYNASDPAMSEDGYISCATCHVDGGHDGRVWDFTGRKEGLRRTPDLRGRSGLAHGNVHWTANFDEIHDFEHDIRDFFGGLGFIPDADFDANHPNPTSTKSGNSGEGYDELNALSAYVSSLGTASVPRSPLRQPTGAFSTTTNNNAANGKLLFEGQGTPVLNCATCHAGNKFTDSIVAPIPNYVLDNVGTVISDGTVVANKLSGTRINSNFSGVDVPSLLGLHASRVYLHHGLAEKLEDVFKFARGKVIQAEAATTTSTVTPATYPTLETAGINIIGERVIAEGGGGDYRGVLGAKFYNFTADNQGLNFTGITGSTGDYTLRIRYRARFSTPTLRVKVNTQTETTTTSMPGTGDRWLWFDHPITLATGSTNTIRLVRNSGGIQIDAIMIVSPADRTAAVAHRQVYDNTQMTDAKRGDLFAYLRQIDGRDATGKLNDPDLVLHYKFDEGSGTTITDSSTNGNNHSTNVTTAQWVSTGKFGGSMGTTDGTTAFASFVPANQADLAFGPQANAYTVSAWVRTNTTQTFRTIFSKGKAGDRQVYAWITDPASRLQAWSGNTSSTSFTSPLMNNNTWRLVTLVNFNDNGTWKSRLYLDGGSNYQQFTSGSTTSTASLRIGAASDGFNSWTGQIDDFRVYKRALTPAEIDQLYQGQEPTGP